MEIIISKFKLLVLLVEAYCLIYIAYHMYYKIKFKTFKVHLLMSILMIHEGVIGYFSGVPGFLLIVPFLCSIFWSTLFFSGSYKLYRERIKKELRNNINEIGKDV